MRPVVDTNDNHYCALMLAQHYAVTYTVRYRVFRVVDPRHPLGGWWIITPRL
jgi:hypothetical protein